MCLRYNSKTNIKHIINKSDDLKQRIIDCDSSTDLNFYNITDKTISHIPEVLPFKYFRQKRFLKMSKKALSNLEEVCFNLLFKNNNSNPLITSEIRFD